MKAIALSTIICLSAQDATTAFHPTQLSNPTPGHPTHLNARRHESSEIDKLRARRLALRPSEPNPMPVVEEEDYDYVAPLEYLYDEDENRDDDAPFHVLLLPSTFNDPRTRIDHVASSCVEVIGIPYDDAYELSMFAKYESFSVLGTWPRKDSIAIGEKLRKMDVECRLVPHQLRYGEWKCPDVVPNFNLDSQDMIDAELSSLMEMQYSHDQNLESFMGEEKDQQKDHPDTYSLSS